MASSYTSFMEHVRTYGHMIKFSRTVFALPFAFTAVIFAWREHQYYVYKEDFDFVINRI